MYTLTLRKDINNKINTTVIVTGKQKTQVI